MFSIKNGQIIDPDGKSWRGAGLNINVEQCSEIGAFNNLKALFAILPGTNYIRVAFHSYTPPSDAGLQAMVALAGSLKIVLQLEDHTGISKPPYTGGPLTTELAFYTAHAKAWASQPYVWFGTFNEPYDSDFGKITTQEDAIYDAIRAAGNQTIVAMELPGGGNPGTVGATKGMRAADYLRMSNIIWDLHYYGWAAKMSTDKAVTDADLIGSIASGMGVAAAQSIRSADGLVPVVIGEFGDSTDGDNVDVDGSQIVASVIDSGLSFTAWHWKAGGRADNLTDGKGGLTKPYGVQVAAGIARVAAGRAVGEQPAVIPDPTKVTPGVWISRSYKGMPYFVLPPDRPIAGKAYPAVLFLHQFQNEASEPGQTSPWFNTQAFRAAHPAYIILPLCSINGRTSSNDFNWGGVTPDPQPAMALALEIFAMEVKANGIDPNQLIITGNSMGGLATHGVLANDAQRAPFAAFLPVSGSCYYQIGNIPAIAAKLKNVPIWSCHGSLDNQVSSAYDITLFKEMQRIGGLMKFTNDPNGAHDTWDSFYPNPAVWAWAFAQKKTGAIPMPTATPSPDNTTVLAPSTTTITDNAGHVWGINDAGQITIDGQIDATTRNVSKIAFVGGAIFQMNTSSLWWKVNNIGDTWAQTDAPVIAAPPPPQPPIQTPATKDEIIASISDLDSAIALLNHMRANLVAIST
jgi:cellulase (glycosyl hydrolase family 5)